MATLYIAEHRGIGRTQIGGSFAPVAECPGVAQQTVAITGASTQSAAFNAATTIIRVHADAVCSVEIGSANPTATTAKRRMAANQTEYFSVIAGEKLAVISNV